MERGMDARGGEVEARVLRCGQRPRCLLCQYIRVRVFDTEAGLSNSIRSRARTQ